MSNSKTNTLVELNARLFEQMDALTNPDLKGAELADEIDRTNAVVKISETIISNASLVLKASMAQADCLNADAKLPKMLVDSNDY